VMHGQTNIKFIIIFYAVGVCAYYFLLLCDWFGFT
jgi:hypothetical protein